MNLPERTLRLIADGRKTVEVRAGYPGMRRIQPGQLILFTSGEQECLTRVKRITEYPSIEALLDGEDRTTISDAASRDKLFERIRGIYPPAKEALGMLAIEIERIDEPPNRRLVAPK